MPSPTRRLAVLAIYMRAVIRDGRRFGHNYVAKGDVVVGAAAWQPAEARPPTLPRLARTGLSLLRCTPSYPRSLPGAVGALAAIEKEEPREPHWYLAMLGVDPVHQNHGIGVELLGPVLAQADREGTLAYLESSNIRNVPWYERHGFRVVKELPLGRNGPPLYLMSRQPRPPEPI